MVAQGALSTLSRAQDQVSSRGVQFRANVVRGVCVAPPGVGPFRDNYPSNGGTMVAEIFCIGSCTVLDVPGLPAVTGVVSPDNLGAGGHAR